jgi:ABC transport system ATP-binding/permease protein
MKACPHCHGTNAADRTSCQHCGRPIPASTTGEWTTATLPVTEAAQMGEVIAQLAAGRQLFSAGASTRRTIRLDELFRGKDRLLIGRAGESDICLPHSSISRVHALLERLPDGALRLRDLGSLNGVLVDGRRIAEPTVVRPNERVGIGPYLFSYADGTVQTVDSSRRLRLEARRLEKEVPVGGGKRRKLLQDINLALEPGEFVSLLGPSGCGKSTLMDCLNGRRPATGGQVLANGEDFYRYFDNFRQSLGYVPQRDIVHTGLTVARALYYTARLRLPTDTGPAELQARLEEVIGLMELGPHRDTLVADLSGGQIKRVSLGAELIARPCLLYIDEATSGLDAGTEARMMRLFRQLADEGKSVICITHNVDNVDLCDLVLVLVRGRLVYLGPPGEGRAYFRVSRVSEVYDRLAEKDAEQWEKEYAASSLYQDYVVKRLGGPPGEGLPAAPPASGPQAVSLPAPKPRGVHRPLLHQFVVLVARYTELLLRDRRTLRLLLLQAPIVAVVILLGFVGKPYQETVLVPRRLSEDERKALKQLIALRKEAKTHEAKTRAQLAWYMAMDPRAKKAADAVQPLAKMMDGGTLERIAEAEGPVVPEQVIVNPRYTYMLLFIVVISILWFGCNNAAKEIVKEEAVYARERSVNLGICPYVASKFVVLTVVSAVQTLLMMLVVYGTLEGLQATLGWPGPAAQYQLDYPSLYGMLVLLSMTGVALGLLLSACVASPDRATTLLPYVLVPQIILGGGIMAVKAGALWLIAVTASPAYWAFRAVRRGVPQLPAEVPQRIDYDDSPWLSAAALLIQITVLLLLTAWCLRRKDVRRA